MAEEEKKAKATKPAKPAAEKTPARKAAAKPAAKKAAATPAASAEAVAAPVTPKEAVAKPAASRPKAEKMLKVTQIGSPIGRESYQRATLKGLGLNKRSRSRVLEDTPAVRGMIARVHHLVRVESAS